MESKKISLPAPSDLEQSLDALTPLQRGYTEARLQGLSPLDAAKAAGMAHPSISCHAMEKHPRVSPLIKLANAASIQRYNISRDDVIHGFMDAVTAAGSSTELTAAWREIGRMLGHYEPDRVDVRHSVENMTRNKLESMSERELLELAEMDEFTLDRDHDLVTTYEVIADDV